jgi:hypothetical protein
MQTEYKLSYGMIGVGWMLASSVACYRSAEVVYKRNTCDRTAAAHQWQEANARSRTPRHLRVAKIQLVVID